jgi:hypothetical protein
MQAAHQRLIQQGALAEERKTVGILIKLLSNIAKSPTEEKFRKIRLTNAKISAAIVEVDGAKDFLAAAGFMEQGDFMQMEETGAGAR